MNTPTHPQTIQIFLPSGEPWGSCIASITMLIVRQVEVPRSPMVADGEQKR